MKYKAEKFHVVQFVIPYNTDVWYGLLGKRLRGTDKVPLRKVYCYFHYYMLVKRVLISMGFNIFKIRSRPSAEIWGKGYSRKSLLFFFLSSSHFQIIKVDFLSIVLYTYEIITEIGLRLSACVRLFVFRLVGRAVDSKPCRKPAITLTDEVFSEGAAALDLHLPIKRI